MAEPVILDVTTEAEIDVRRLKRFELLAPLSERELTVIARCCREATYPSGSILVRQGEVARHIYLLEEGAVNIYREKLGKIQKVALIEGPGIFGEMALLSRDRIRTATVRAAADVQVFTIAFASILAALRCMPVLRDQLRQLLYSRGFRPDVSASSGTPPPAQEQATITAKIAALCH